MHRRTWVARAALMAAAALALAAIGCGSSGSSGGGGTTSKAASSGKQIKVLYFVPTLQDSSYAREGAAAQKVAKQFPNVTLNFQSGQGRFAAQDLISKIQQAVTTGTNAIVVNCGATCPDLQPALADAIAKGVKIVVVGQPVPKLVGYSSFIQVNETAGTVPAGRYMAEQLKDGGEIGIIRCVVGNPVSDAREAGFREGLQGSKVQVVARADARCDPAQARGIMENFLTAHPNLKGVFSDTDVALVGALQAIPASKKLIVIGHDSTVAVLQAMKQGKVQADIQFNNEELATMGLETAIKAASGESVPLHQFLPVYPVVTKDNVDALLARIAAHEAG
jgi:ribose transport system substrate-binding protein